MEWPAHPPPLRCLGMHDAGGAGAFRLHSSLPCPPSFTLLSHGRRCRTLSWRFLSSIRRCTPMCLLGLLLHLAAVSSPRSQLHMCKWTRTTQLSSLTTACTSSACGMGTLPTTAFPTRGRVTSYKVFGFPIRVGIFPWLHSTYIIRFNILLCLVLCFYFIIFFNRISFSLTQK